MSYGSYQRRSVDNKRLTEHHSHYLDQNMFQNSRLPMPPTSPISKYQTHNVYTNQKPQNQYRSRTPSSSGIHNIDQNKSLIDQPYSYNASNEGSFRRITKNNGLVGRSDVYKYEIQSNEMVPTKNHSKKVYFNDFDEVYNKYAAKEGINTVSNQKNQRKQNIRETYNDKFDLKAGKENLIDKQNRNILQQVEQKKGYQSSSKMQNQRAKSNKLTKNSEYPEENEVSKTKQVRSIQDEKEIMKKIGRINQLNYQINSRLQKMLAKMGCNQYQ